jgi:tetratricopeptide (TPR) repeat protein
MRLGQNYARLARPDLALPELIRAEALATTPYERHLTRLFAGAVLERMGRKAEAIGALRGALHALPRASSASFALAPLLLQVDAREEAAEVLETAMRLPQVDDPLLAYYAGDPTAVSRALARLRDEARR